MSNVFKRFTEVVNKPNRASYDLSFQNNLTMKFGKLYPVFCKEVLPGDSFKIQPTFNFNFMPLVSPIQTRMKATLHFFYVRNRPLWKDFMDWDGMTKEGLTPPYIKLTEQNRDMVTTGEIGDFLGIPSEIYDTVYEGLYEQSLRGAIATNTPVGYNLDSDTYGLNFTEDSKFNTDFVGQKLDVIAPFVDELQYSGYHSVEWQIIPYLPSGNYKFKWHNDSVVYGNCSYKWVIFDSNSTCVWQSETYTAQDSRPNNTIFSHELDLNISDAWYDSDVQTVTRYNNLLLGLVVIRDDQNPQGPFSRYFSVTLGYQTSSHKSVSEMELSELPWASDNNPDGLRLNAFPFRAYEAIYNSFYRDERNNPRMVNGQPEYNKYITTDEGGADTTHYKLFQRNWEPDYLTTAVQSPQQGVAPLVGITSVNAAGTIEITDGNGVTYTAQTKLAEDGDTIQGIKVLSENSPTAVNRALVDLASTGISISDLRNVNALQRWLEINMRRGLRYRDQVKSHYGVDIEFKELQMPEFIGGVNEDVIVNRISQTVETEENPLGSLAGQAGVLGTSNHKISHYCDEKGYIIGIFSIAPVPNYSQNLPKHMIKTSQLDYFTPEFAHIGMQPILNSEVSPLQANLEGKLNDVFGYQRPWYEYLASTDEVHGQFRDTMRRYLINRVYDGTPELGSEFLTIDPDTVNDVFAVTEDTDKIYGQIWFNVTAKRPIASNVTPRIEP